jgi:phytoene synthase
MNALLSTRWALRSLGAFSLVAILGYWTFGVHPENLARFPQAAGFYAHSFAFFAQAQIVLSALALWIILRKADSLKWLWGFVAVYGLSLASELAGTMTGFPFGDYQYTHLLGWKWADHVPLVIPLSWFTMAFPVHVIVERLIGKRVSIGWRMGVSALMLTAWDLVLDPAMSFLVPYWIWGEAGAFYGMPWINLFGWFVTGLVLSAALHATRSLDYVPRVKTSSLFAYYGLVFALPAGMLVVAGHVLLVVLVTLGITLAWAAVYWIGRSGGGLTEHFSSDGSSEGAPAEISGHLGRIAGATEDYFKSHSRSFSIASGLFTPEDRHRVAGLYAFCRMTDDIADEPGLSAKERHRLLNEWTDLVLQSFFGVPSGIEWLDSLMADLAKHQLPVNIIQDLIDGVRSDLDRSELETQTELAKYSYQVASTVGIMMCYLFDETDEWVLDRAAALGLGMQLTNIYRDVGADLKLGRVYLPKEWLDQFNVEAEYLTSFKDGDDVSESYVAMMNHLEHYANQQYAKAWEAIPGLSWRFGPSVCAAAIVYKAIHPRIRSNNFDNLTNRAFTTTFQKIVLICFSTLYFSFIKGLSVFRGTGKTRAESSIRDQVTKNNLSWVFPFLTTFQAAMVAFHTVWV